MMPPFVPETPAVRAAVLEAAEALTLPNGGILPGEDWRGNPFDALEDRLPTPADPCPAKKGGDQVLCR